MITATARWPARLKPGLFPAPVHITDWMPTFCALAGCQPKDDLRWDGRDIWPALSGAKPHEDRVIYTAGPNFRSVALRDGDWKLVVHRAPPRANRQSARYPQAELYNVAKDPNETQNLASTYPQRTAALQAKLRNVAQKDRDSIASD